MKKNYLFLLAAFLLAPFFGIAHLNAAVPVPSGFVTSDPVVSTSASPVWYNMMATNSGDDARANRYMYWDGTSLKTDLINSPGITDALQNDKYLWRLEQGVTGAGYVVIVNKTSGKRLYADASIASNGYVGVADAGIDWKMATATSTGAAGAVAGQYCFNFEPGLRYLNAGDGVSMG